MLTLVCEVKQHDHDLSAVLREHCLDYIKEQLTWPLKDIEENMILKGKANHNLIEKSLIQVKISFKNRKKGRSRNSHKVKQDLSNLE